MANRQTFTPCDSFEGLLKQFKSLNTLFNVTQGMLNKMTDKVASLSDERFQELEQRLESETEMNHS